MKKVKQFLCLLILTAFNCNAQQVAIEKPVQENVLTFGILNKFTVVVENTQCEDVVLKVEHCDVEKEGCIFMVNPRGYHIQRTYTLNDLYVEMRIGIKQKKDTLWLKNERFRIEEAYFNCRIWGSKELQNELDSLPGSHLLAAKSISIYNNLRTTNFKILQYRAQVKRKDGSIYSNTFYSNTIPVELKQQYGNMGLKDTLIIDRIIYENNSNHEYMLEKPYKILLLK